MHKETDYLTRVIHNGLSLFDVPDQFRTHKLCLTAVAYDWTELQYVPDQFRTLEVCTAAARQSREAEEWIPRSVRIEMLYLELVRIDGMLLETVPVRLRSPEICLAAVLTNGSALRFCPPATDLSSIRPAEAEAKDWKRVKAAIRRYGLEVCSWHGEAWDPEAEGTGGTEHSLAGWAQALSKDLKIRRMHPADAGVRLLPRHAHLFFNTSLTRAQVLEIP